MKLTELKCPFCGAPVNVPAGAEVAHCAYCRGSFAVEREALKRETPVRPSPKPSPRRDTKKTAVRTGAIVWIAVLAVLAWILLPSIHNISEIIEEDTDLFPSGGVQAPAAEAYRTEPLSKPVRLFAEIFFEKSVSDISAEEYATIKYLNIKQDDTIMNDTWVFTCARATDGEGKAVEPQVIYIRALEEIQEEDMQVFTGLEALYLNNSSAIGWGENSKNCNLRCLTELQYFDGSYYESRNNPSTLFYDPAQIRYLRFGYLNSDEILKSLTVFTGLESLSVQDFSETMDLTLLAKLPALRSLSFGLQSNVSRDLSFLSAMTGLRSLSLYSRATVDLSVLFGMPQLESLALSGMDSVKTLAFVKNMPQLHDLTVADCAIRSLEDLRGNITLTRLELTGNGNLTDFSALSTLTGLHTLYVYNYWASSTTVMPNLAPLTLLREVYISGRYFDALRNCSGITALTLYADDDFSLSTIAAMTELETLTVDGDAGIEDPEMLKHFEKLTTLRTSGRVFTNEDNAVMFNLPGVTTLDLNFDLDDMAYPYIRLGMSALTENKDLRVLNLSACSIYDLESSDIWTSYPAGRFADRILPNFTGLEELYAQGIELDDLSFVSHMPNLCVLDIRDNYVTDVTPLAELDNLKVLYCTDNPILNLEVLPDRVQVIQD